MARFVVLEFADNAEAERFAEQYKDFGNYYDGFESSGAVVGLFAKPTQFHDSTCPSTGRKASRSFTRGKKFGWWVCATCKKPTNLTVDKLMRQVISQGRNFLTQPLSEEETQPPSDVATVQDQGWGVLGR